MVRDLRGLRILITGASSGIGHALAKQAVEGGARVLLTSRSGDKLDALVHALAVPSGTVVAVPADVTSERDRRLLLDAATDRLGGLDVLVNNAGVGSFGHFADSSEEVLRQVMEVNFFAPAEMIRLLIPLIRNGRQPAIVNVSSMCGRRGMPAWTEYSASKYALCGLTESLRAELVRFGIDVLLVLPGLTKTGLGQHLLRNEGRMKIDFNGGMAPEKVATGILSALRCNRAETVLGGEARWMLRFNRFLPRLLDRLIANKVRRLYAS
jgi:short-subunit dehydrogenase